MKCLELLLHASLIFTIAATFCENSKNNSITTIAYVLPGNVLPVHYNVRLRVPYPKERNVSFYGKFDVSLIIRCATRNIGLHSLGMVINKSATKLIEKNHSRTNYRPIYYSYDTKKNILIITFGDELKPGRYKLYVKFVGTSPKLYEYELVMFYRQSYKNKEEYSVLIARMPFMPVAISEDFPCWDQSLKASFTIAVNHHLRYRILSYSEPKRVYFTKKGVMMWTHFPKISSISSCAIMVVVLNFDHISEEKETINLWCRSHLKSHVKFAYDVAKNVTRRLNHYFKHSNILKIHHVAVPKFALLESTYMGINIYNEQDIIYNNEIHPTFRMMDVAKKIAYQVAHQWSGVIISPTCWSNMWLTEGFSSFLGTYILDKIFKKWRLMDFLVVKNLQESLHADLIDSLDFNSLTVYNPYNYYFNPALYKKAPVILRTLQHIMTDEVFRKGTVIYLNYHTATVDNLWFAMQLALDKSNVLRKNFKIREVMDSWINYKQYPLVTVTRNYETGKTIISQKQFYSRRNNENDNHKWWIPVTFATQTNPNFSDTSSISWLSPLDQNISLHIDPNDWIIVNLQQVGYYRINYDSTNWRKIANYLNYEEYTKIHVLNRAQIIDDAYVLLMEKQLDILTFLNLTSYLSRETDYVAWYPMFRILSLLTQFFSFPESKGFKLHMAKIFTGLLESVGYEEKLNEDDLMKLNRLDATKWACIVGNLRCKKMATVKLDEYLANPSRK